MSCCHIPLPGVLLSSFDRVCVNKIETAKLVRINQSTVQTIAHWDYQYFTSIEGILQTKMYMANRCVHGVRVAIPLD